MTDTRLNDVLAWLEEHCKPYYKQLLSSDHGAAATALKRVAAELKGTTFDKTQQTIVHDRLRYLEYHLYRDAASRQVAAGILADLLREFAAPVNDALVAALRRSYVLQLRIIDERDGGAAYPPAELHADLAVLPAEARGNEVEYHLAIWGFLHDEPELIEHALAHFTCKPGPQYGDFIWQHINLMHQLNKGSATSRDVAEMVRRILHPRMWRNIESTAWSECVRRSLVDGEVAGLLARKLKGFDIRYPEPRQSGGKA